MKRKISVFAVLIAFLISPVATQGSTVSFEGNLLTTDPVPVQPDDDARITFKVRNTGDREAESVRLEIVDSFPFSLKPDRKRNYDLGSISPGEEYYITSEVLVAEDAPDGLNDFKVRLKFGDLESVENIPVNVRAQDVELNLANLQTSPDRLRPDTENNRMTLEVVNNGDKTAESVEVNLNLPEEFEERSSFSTRQSLGNLASGEVKSANFDFDISEEATEGSKNVEAELSYSSVNSSTNVKKRENFSIYLSGKPQYRITSVESNLQTGERGEIRMEVENFGSVKSESTRVRILDNSDLPFDFESPNKFMGSLESGSNGTVVFNPKIEEDASAKDYLLDFEVRGVKDSEVFTEQKVVSLSVRESSSSGSSIPLAAAGIIAVLVAVAYYFRNRLREILSSGAETAQD